MDLKTCWGFVPILCGTEAISLSGAEEGANSVVSRQVVLTKGIPWAQLAKVLQPCLSRKPLCPNSAKPLSPPEEKGRCKGGKLPQSHPANLPARVDPIPIAEKLSLFCTGRRGTSWWF